MKRQNFDFLQGPIARGLIIFCIPILLSNLFQQLYNTADTTIVGHMLGDQSLAAIGACSALFETLIGFALGFGNGFAIPVAHAYGAGNAKKLRQSVACGIVIGLVLTLALSLLTLPYLRPLLNLMNTPAEIIDQAFSYISVILKFIVVLFTYNLCAALLRAVGDSTAPLFFLIFSSILNVGLDILLIRMGLGVQGTAIATVMAQSISSVLCVVYIFKKQPCLIPRWEDFRPDWPLWKELFLQGATMASMGATVHIGSIVVQTTMNPLGASVIAGHVSGRKLYNLLLLPIVTMPAALSTFVSQNLGAQQPKRALKGIRTGNLICVACCFVSIAVAFSFGHNLIALISGSSDSLILSTGVRYVTINTLFFCVLVYLMDYRYALQCFGHEFTSLISSFIELAGKIVFAIFIIPKVGYIGIILCEPLLWVVMFVHIAICYRSAVRKLPAN